MRYRFDDFLVDLSARTLERRGERVHLERRGLDLLIHLLENRGRLVTKEELLASVWKGRPVTDNALSRCIHMVRETLEDSARDSRYLITTHGQGIRFSGDVEVIEEATASALSSRRPGMLWAALAVALAAIAGIWVFRDRADRETVAIAILPVHSDAQSPALDLLSVSVGDLLYQRLSELPGLRLRGPGSFAHDQDLQRRAEELGADYVVATRLDASQSQSKVQLLVTVRGIEEATETQLGRFDLPALDSDQGIQQFMAVREAVVRNIAEQLLPAMPPADRSATQPQSALAYRLYLQARDLLSRPGCDGVAPSKLLEHALSLDPAFVPSWVQLGWAHYGSTASCGLDRSYYQLALEAADQALALAPSWTPAIGLRATVLVETGQLEAAYRTLADAYRVDPTSADLAFSLSYVLCYAGRLERALVWLDRSLALDPQFLTAKGWTPNVLLYRQQPGAFLKRLPATRSTLFNYYRGFALSRTGRNGPALDALQEAYHLNPNDTFGRLAQALIAVLENEPLAALAVLDGLHRQREDFEATDGEVSYKIAQLYAMAGAPESALRELSLSTEQGFVCPDCVAADSAFAPLKEFPGYSDLMERMLSRHQDLDLTPIAGL